jgi:hypothetical protein
MVVTTKPVLGGIFPLPHLCISGIMEKLKEGDSGEGRHKII